MKTYRTIAGVSAIFVLGLMVLAVSVGCTSILSGKFDPTLTQEADRKIERDSQYQMIDEICRSIAAPENSKLIGKTHLINSVGIVYYYEMTISNDQAENYYDRVMSDLGWERKNNDLLSRVLSYEKDEMRVNITLEQAYTDANLAIACKKRK